MTGARASVVALFAVLLAFHCQADSWRCLNMLKDLFAQRVSFQAPAFRRCGPLVGARMLSSGPRRSATPAAVGQQQPRAEARRN